MFKLFYLESNSDFLGFAKSFSISLRSSSFQALLNLHLKCKLAKVEAFVLRSWFLATFDPIQRNFLISTEASLLKFFASRAAAANCGSKCEYGKPFPERRSFFSFPVLLKREGGELNYIDIHFHICMCTWTWMLCLHAIRIIAVTQTHSHTV